MQRSQLSKLPFQKHLVGTLALMVLGFNFTKRYMTFPHAHKDDSKPMLLLNGDLHPFERQPPVSKINHDYIERVRKLTRDPTLSTTRSDEIILVAAHSRQYI